MNFIGKFGRSIWGSQPASQPSPTVLDKWAKEIVVNKNNQLAKAYFGAGGSAERVAQIASENGLNLDSKEKKQFHQMELMQQSLAGHMIHEILMNGKRDQATEIFIAAPAGLEKVVRQFKMIFEGIHASQYIQKKQLTDRLEQFAARVEGSRVDEAFEKGFDENDRAMQDEILYCAVENGNPLLVNRLIRKELLKTAMTHAVCSGQEAIIELLISRGAELKPKHLHKAVLAGQIILMKYFKEKGFDFLAVDKAGMTPFSIAAGFEDEAMFAELQRLHAVNAPVPRFFFEQQMMCHRFGLREKFKTKDGQEIKLQGLYPGMAEKPLLKSFENFCTQLGSDQVDLHAVLSILTKEISADIGYCKAGWDGHATYFVYSRSQQLLIKCNRGDGSEERPGMTLYKINKMEYLDDVINLAGKRRKKEKGREFFNNEIDGMLGLEEIAHIPHKSQGTGNCTWASAKLVVKAIILIQLWNKIPIEDAKELSHQVYKSWTAWDRKQAVDSFIKSFENMKKSQVPFREEDGIIPEKILLSVFSKCLRLGFLDCLPTIIQAIPQALSQHTYECRWALIAGSKAGKLDLIQLLLGKALDIDAEIMSAVYEGDRNRMRALLKHAHARVAEKLAEKSGQEMLQKLFSFAPSDGFKMLKLLRKYKVNIDFETLQNEAHALLFQSLFLGKLDDVSFLFSYPGFKLDILRKEKIGEGKNWNALMLACELGNEPMVRLMLGYCQEHSMRVQPDQDWTENMRQALEKCR